MDDPEKAIRVANVSTPVVPSNTYHEHCASRNDVLERQLSFR